MMSIKTLFDTCIDTIINNNIVCVGLYPDLLYPINKKLTEKECGTVVTNRISIEKNVHYDEFIGCHDGVFGVLQNKNHVFINTKLYEKECKIYGKGNGGGFLQCSLILYYLEKEYDFDSWYVHGGNRWYQIATGH